MVRNKVSKFATPSGRTGSGPRTRDLGGTASTTELGQAIAAWLAA
jgi:hypothetical protein